MVLLQGMAITSSLFHVLIDAWIGLFRSGPAMTLGQALTFAVIAALYGWWLAPLAVGTWGMRGALLALVVLAGGWAALANGVAGLFVCFPCAEAAPYQDIAHIGSLLTGIAAAWYAWVVYRRTAGPVNLWLTSNAVVFVVVAVLLMAANATPLR